MSETSLLDHHAQLADSCIPLGSAGDRAWMTVRDKLHLSGLQSFVAVDASTDFDRAVAVSYFLRLKAAGFRIEVRPSTPTEQFLVIARHGTIEVQCLLPERFIEAFKEDTNK